MILLIWADFKGRMFVPTSDVSRQQRALEEELLRGLLAAQVRAPLL